MGFSGLIQWPFSESLDCFAKRLASGLLGEEDPGAALGGDGEFESGGGGRVERYGLGRAAVHRDVGLGDKAGIVERDADVAGEILGERVIEHGQAFFAALRIGVEDAIPIEAAGTAQVDDIA